MVRLSANASSETVSSGTLGERTSEVRCRIAVSDLWSLDLSLCGDALQRGAGAALECAFEVLIIGLVHHHRLDHHLFGRRLVTYCSYRDLGGDAAFAVAV